VQFVEHPQSCDCPSVVQASMGDTPVHVPNPESTCLTDAGR
jgi:hypothetical protein